MNEIIRISSNTRWEPVFGYSRAVKAGDLIVVSGTTATDANGIVVGVNQMYTQARQAITNIASALARAGAGLSDVIRTRIYVTDIGRSDDVARAHREAFGAAPPAATLIEIRRFLHPDMMIEIEAVAVVPTLKTAATDPGAAAPLRQRKAITRKPRASARKSGSKSKRRK